MRKDKKWLQLRVLKIWYKIIRKPNISRPKSFLFFLLLGALGVESPRGGAIMCGWCHSRAIAKKRKKGITQLVSTATVLFRLCTPPTSVEHPLRSLVEFHAVRDAAQT